MADGTHIEWTDATWSPVTGCQVVSPGCTNCYAMRLAGTRLQHHWSRKGLTQDSKAGPVWTGDVRFNEQWLDQPLRWRRGRKIFVCAHGDLFAKGVPDAWIDRVFAVMALAPQHTFQVLTKRAARMRGYIAASTSSDRVAAAAVALARAVPGDDWVDPQYIWPPPHVWLGVSVEDQARADERIPHLLATPATKRFISAEPLLGPVDLRSVPGGEVHLAGGVTAAIRRGALRGGVPGIAAHLDWVIAGGESGPGARPMQLAWARSLVEQCRAAGVACFVKQLGAHPLGTGFLDLKSKKGGDWSEWPADLRVREFPA